MRKSQQSAKSLSNQIDVPCSFGIPFNGSTALLLAKPNEIKNPV
jgi:hypothetical protein